MVQFSTLDLCLRNKVRSRERTLARIPVFPEVGYFECSQIQKITSQVFRITEDTSYQWLHKIELKPGGSQPLQNPPRLLLSLYAFCHKSENPLQISSA